MPSCSTAFPLASAHGRTNAKSLDIVQKRQFILLLANNWYQDLATGDVNVDRMHSNLRQSSLLAEGPVTKKGRILLTGSQPIQQHRKRHSEHQPIQHRPSVTVSIIANPATSTASVTANPALSTSVIANPRHSNRHSDGTTHYP
jgi:hypothetical protein